MSYSCMTFPQPLQLWLIVLVEGITVICNISSKSSCTLVAVYYDHFFLDYFFYYSSEHINTLLNQPQIDLNAELSHVILHRAHFMLSNYTGLISTQVRVNTLIIGIIERKQQVPHHSNIITNNIFLYVIEVTSFDKITMQIIRRHWSKI